ncbi:glycosyltransferase [Leifsonia sp. YIM 134122]|uniref:Glycosyltransferase n=1 Tax=Leifsonia stereocauli TaxID=3134136 RepID=A0ABU9W6M7_9MICO
MTLDIMLPFYGRVDHFRDAVTSVLGQTDPDWRLVIIDDHYPDEAAARWVTGIGDARIEYRRHAENHGINRTFQECVDDSRAEWFTIFGCDDVMRPEYVATIARLASANPGASMIHPGVGIIDEDGRPARTLVDAAKAFYRPSGPETVTLTGEALAVSVVRGNWMNFPAVAWRGDVVRPIGFRPGYQVVQDLALVVDIAEQGGSLVVDHQVVFDYRRHAGSVSSWRAVDGSRFVEEQGYFRASAARFDERGWRRAARAARLHLSSRINAATQLPGALAHRDLAGAGILARHSVGIRSSGTP